MATSGNALPTFFTSDLFRTVTIALWGIQLSLTLATIVYAVKLHMYIRRNGPGAPESYRTMLWWSWWHVTLFVVLFSAMATEISWKTIFQGVGQDSNGWTYANPAIYVLGCVALSLILKVSRGRYLLAKVRYKLRHEGRETASS